MCFRCLLRVSRARRRRGATGPRYVVVVGYLGLSLGAEWAALLRRCWPVARGLARPPVQSLLHGLVGVHASLSQVSDGGANTDDPLACGGLKIAV